ncbi:MAG: BspA family leucine-rich repeat surface protein [Thiohalomonadales bacterium]
MFISVVNKKFIISLVLVFSSQFLVSCGGSNGGSGNGNGGGGDTTAPVVTLNGKSLITLLIGGIYTELGATATDNIDANINVTISGAVDTSSAGTYIIKYSATDLENNTGVATRTVEVIIADTTAPVISLNGKTSINIVQGDAYIDSGATAIDNIDININIVITGSVDTATIGSYTITYTATDNAGNTSIATRTIIVEVGRDTTAPVVTLNGESLIRLLIGGIYTELGATATDNIDANINVTISGAVDTSSAGTYIIKYSATDLENNTGVATRTVEVIIADTTAPVISLNGKMSINIVQGDAYIEAGATAIDNIDININIVITGSVDTATIGTYTITYTATDNAGNTSFSTRTIIVEVARPFITTWKTDNAGASANNQVMIGTLGTGYNYSVDWGDNKIDSAVTGDITHTYATAGIYTVSISGDFPRIYFNFDLATIVSDYNKLLSIEQWGTNKWQTMARAFSQCVNLVGNALDTPNLSLVSDMSGMFSTASAFNQNIGTWDVSTVTNMNGMFAYASSFNGSIDAWDVSSVLDMSQMFSGATEFNQNLATWDVSSVTTMNNMFASAKAFNQNLNTWNVSSVTDMSDMFRGSDAFNQPLSVWDVSSVIYMGRMFADTIVFNQVLNNWNVSSVINMGGMFDGARAFNQALSNWDVSSVTYMGYMFGSFSGSFNGIPGGVFNQDLSAWDVSSVNSMSGMFSYTLAFNQNLSTWNFSTVTSMSSMFRGAEVYNQDQSTWDVSSVNDMGFMFSDALAFNQDLSTWDVSSVTKMAAMFKGALAFNQDLSTWNVSAVTNMMRMFSNTAVYNQSLSAWDVSSVTDMREMFFGASAFNQDLAAWNVSLVTDMQGLFYRASVFDQDLSSWNVSAVTRMNNMFGFVTLSVANYDALLNGWSMQSLQNGVFFGGGNSKYSIIAQPARDTLTTGFNWVVTDGGLAP